MRSCPDTDIDLTSESRKQNTKEPLCFNQHTCFLQPKIVRFSRFDSCSTNESSVFPVRTYGTLTVQDDKTGIKECRELKCADYNITWFYLCSARVFSCKKFTS